MPMTFTTTNSTGLAGGYASVANASYNAGGGSFSSVAGRFGCSSLIVNGKVDRTTVRKEPAIAQLATGVTFTKRPVSRYDVAGTAQQVANATTYAPTTLVSGLFGGQGVFGNASLSPVIQNSAKATMVMYFGAPVGCPISPSSPSTASYAFWS